MEECLSQALGRMFHNISESIEDAKDELSALDGAIGDADHGVTLSIGFNAVKSVLARRQLKEMKPVEVMSLAAFTFLNSVGASTGPLYATAFTRAGQALDDEQRASLSAQASLVKGIAAGIRERGKGQRGDKTMLDAWIPAAEAAAEAVRRSASVGDMWRDILGAAEAGAASTSSMIALKGRAARLGERAIGHVDPGAASAVVILKAMAASFCNQTD